MAKKKRKVEIIDKELTPTVLAKVEEKKVNLIGLFVLFVIFGVVVYFLPDISMYVDSFFNPTINNPTPNNPSGNGDGEDNELETKKYEYSSNLSIDINSLFILNKFSINENKLIFTINNSMAVSLNLDKYQYFLEIYNSSNTILQRIQLKDITVAASRTTELSYDLVDANIAYFTLREIPIEEYPAYVVAADANKQGMLVCRKGYEQINYLLEDNKLYSIEDIYSIDNTDVNYSTLWSTYLSLAATYNNLNGVTSEVTTGDTGLKFTTKIDLTINSNVSINKIVYPKDTDAKVMSFELESNGYKCE